MDEKVRPYSLTFLPFLASFSKIEKSAINGRKVKAIAHSLPFLPFFASFSKIGNSAKNGRKVKAIALLLCHFLPLFKK